MNSISIKLTLMATGCRSVRSEPPFSAAYNRFCNLYLSNGSEGASGRQLLHMGLRTLCHHSGSLTTDSPCQLSQVMSLGWLVV